jgi:hypothetical protein
MKIHNASQNSVQHLHIALTAVAAVRSGNNGNEMTKRV